MSDNANSCPINGADRPTLAATRRAPPKTELRARLAAASAGIGIWEWDARQNHTVCDARTRAILQVERRESLSQESWLARVHPDDLPRYQEIRSAHLRGEANSHTADIRIRRQDGSYRWVEDFGKVITRDASGDPLRMIGTLRDIEARKSTEACTEEYRAKLARREQILSAILEHTPAGVLLIDEKTLRIVEFNDHAASMHGYTRDEFANLIVSDLKVSVSSAIPEEPPRRTRAHGPISFEDKHKRKNGSILDVEARLTRLQVDGHWHMLALWHDISDRKHSEKHLREKEEELRALVENTPDGIVRYDRELRHVYVNSAMCGFIGSDADAILGERLESPDGFKQPEKYLSVLHEVFNTERPRQLEMEYISLRGKPHWALVSFSPERDADGKVATVLVIMRDITNLVHQRNRMRRLAYGDLLTGLANRAGFMRLFAKILKQCRRSGETAGLLLFDLDRFKDINDTLGHPIGDELLRQIGARLLSCIRRGDILARLGGDEFALLLSDVGTGKDIENAVHRIQQIFEAPFWVDDREMFISVSIGVAVCPPDGETIDELIANADAAMYSAKRNGCGSVQFYSRKLTERATRRLVLSTSLQSSSVESEFKVVYQPKVALATGHYVGAEALVRWLHPELGLLMPDSFISLAEETGKIVEIGRHVLNEACRAVAEWNRQSPRQQRIAVNLSCRQFVENDIVADIWQALNSTGCQGNWLECEITESLILRSDQRTHSALAELTRMGVTIAIDDFGTGQSILSYLNQIHIDVIKLDKTFVIGMEQDRRKAELLKAFISFAGTLGMHTVAEGIEAAAQTQLLERFGCSFGQGNFFGKPVTKEDFHRFL